MSNTPDTVKKPRKNASPYPTPLRSRKAIVDYVTGKNGWDDRSYDHKHHLFCFNVKIYNFDLSFDNLLKVWGDRGEGNKELLASDTEYVARLRERFDENGNRENQLWEWAIETMQRTFWSDRDSKPDDDGWNSLFDGSVDVHARFQFHGRSAGWLVLTEFGIEGVNEEAAKAHGGKCLKFVKRNDKKQTYGRVYKLDADYTKFDETWTDPEYDHQDNGYDPLNMDTQTLRALYVYLTMLTTDLKRSKLSEELEYQAAFDFFCNVANDIQPTQEIVDNSIGEGI